MMKRIREWMKRPITLVPLVLIATVVSMAAGRVNGLFHSVDSTTGYTINGSAGGNAGYAACTSTGAKIDGFCSLAAATVFYQTITSSIATLPQEPVLNFGSEFAVTDNSTISTIVHMTSVATGATVAPPCSINFDNQGRVHTASVGSYVPRTSGTNGTYNIECDGTIDEDFQANSLNDNTPTVITVPHTYTTILSLNCTANSSNDISGNPRTMAAGANSSTTVNVTAGGSGSTASCHMRAI